MRDRSDEGGTGGLECAACYVSNVQEAIDGHNLEYPEDYAAARESVARVRRAELGAKRRRRAGLSHAAARR